MHLPHGRFPTMLSAHQCTLLLSASDTSSKPYCVCTAASTHGTCRGAVAWRRRLESCGGHRRDSVDEHCRRQTQRQHVQLFKVADALSVSYLWWRWRRQIEEEDRCRLTVLFNHGIDGTQVLIPWTLLV